MVDDKWMLDEGIFYPVSGNVILHTTPGQGVWELVKDPDPRSSRLGLRKMSEEFTFDFKIYETGGKEAIKRVCDLWNNEKYIDSNKNLGVIFNGIKGTGKTISAKLLCNQIGLPVIVVNQSFEGAVLEFIPRLSFEAVILIDEAEKTFSEKDDAHILLKLIDGVYNRTRKLYILTTNKLHINETLLGRPGRIRYIQEFTNLPKVAVEEYLEDNLEDKSKKQAVLDIVDLLEISTIDILKSIVEEFNIFGDIGGERSIMNIPKCSYVFDAVYFRGYTDEDVEKIRQIIKENKPENVTMYEWFNNVKGPFIKGGKVDCTEENVIGTVVKNDSVEKSEEKKEDNDEEKDVTDLFSNGDDKYCYTVKITSRYQDLFKGSDCNEGTVMSEVSEDGFLMIKDYYGNLELYMLLRQRKTNSLYKPFAF